MKLKVVFLFVPLFCMLQSCNILFGVIGMNTKASNLPTEVRDDPELEAQMLALVRKYWEREGYDTRKYYEARITRDWVVERNELTGAIIRRYINAAPIFEVLDGNQKGCYYSNSVFEQEYYGNEYSALKLTDIGHKKGLECTLLDDMKE